MAKKKFYDSNKNGEKRNDKSSKRKTAVRTILYHLLFIALDFSQKGVKNNLFPKGIILIRNYFYYTIEN